MSVLHKPLMSWYALNIKYIGGLNMKLDDVVEVNLVDLSPKETYRPVREMAAKIITEDVEIRIYNGASREILKNLNNYLWYRDQNVSKYK
ncbi:Hypothetical protein LRC_04620 [Ligilactobacillus ruminis ATCC 27782]|uniref:Uncharacterized protein n=6 Tax=Ligilactobacillus ruminis TaxID=1623 RepID=G2SLS6_LIGR2|nr:Hypothetical protein LRC_04620 [Ligilactobacillus ruminis ATCC 27782]